MLAITVCTWLDTMCASNRRTLIELTFPYVIPLYDTQLIGYLYVQLHIREFFRSPPFPSKTVLINFPAHMAVLINHDCGIMSRFVFRYNWQGNPRPFHAHSTAGSMTLLLFMPVSTAFGLP